MKVQAVFASVDSILLTDYRKRMNIYIGKIRIIIIDI
jgi:hypothetical protein